MLWKVVRRSYAKVLKQHSSNSWLCIWYCQERSISPKWGVTQTAQNNASASCLNVSLTGCSSTSSSCGSSLVKVLEKPLPSMQATFQSRERRLLISASSGRDALLQWNGDWRFSVSALSTLTVGTVWCYVRNRHRTRRIWKSKAKSTTLLTGILTYSANTRTSCLT